MQTYQVPLTQWKDGGGLLPKDGTGDCRFERIPSSRLGLGLPYVLDTFLCIREKRKSVTPPQVRGVYVRTTEKGRREVRVPD